MTKQQFDALVKLISFQTECILSLIQDPEERFELRRRHGEAMVEIGDVEFLTQREIAEREIDELERVRSARIERVKARAYANDPEVWISYSGKAASEKRVIDQKRRASRDRADQQLSNEGDIFV